MRKFMVNLHKYAKICVHISQVNSHYTPGASGHILRIIFRNKYTMLRFLAKQIKINPCYGYQDDIHDFVPVL